PRVQLAEGAVGLLAPVAGVEVVEHAALDVASAPDVEESPLVVVAAVDEVREVHGGVAGDAHADLRALRDVRPSAATRAPEGATTCRRTISSAWSGVQRTSRP